MSNRSIIPDDVILPMYNDAGSRLSYSLEPQFPADTIDALQNVAWNWSSGELSVTITAPDGARIGLGTARFVAKSGNGPTTKQPSFTAWQPHVYGRYSVTATGWIEDMDGRRYEGGGEFFVYSVTRPPGAAGLRIDGASQRTFPPAAGVTIAGTSSASRVHYTLITPGAVIEQGDLEVRNGTFQYVFDPVAVHQKVPLYDITSITTGKPQLGRVIHLTFFSEEKAGTSTFFDVTRVLLRGATAIAARPAVATTLALGALPAVPPASGLELPGDGALPAAGPRRISAWGGHASRDWDASVDALVRSGELVLASSRPDTILSGRVHERLRQVYKGVPVVSAGQAARMAAQRTGGRVAAGQAPELVILPLEHGRYALAWRAEMRSAVDVRVCFIDAGSGAILLEYSNIKEQLAPGAPLAGRVEVMDFKGDASRTASEIGGGLSHAAAAGGVRSLSDPAIHGDPDHGGGMAADSAVHSNSTIASHAFYLAIEGGTHRTSGLAVEGVGASNRDQIERVFYRAFVYMLPSAATFETAREATIQSALDLYGAQSTAVRSIEQAGRPWA